MQGEKTLTIDKQTINCYFYRQIWDLRRRQTLYTIPAHTNVVTDVKYQKSGGNFIVSASYDGSIKVSSQN